jgi:Spy/CpxP family protein refolding chaperone
MHRFSIVTAGVLAAALVTGSSAFAQGGGRGSGGHRGARAGGPGLPLGALNLTEQQRQQVRDIQGRSRDETRQLQERLRTARLAQQQAIEAAPLDESRIRAASQDVAEAETELTVQRAKLRADVFEILTPAQREQATKAASDRRARTVERRERPRQPAPAGQ